MGYNAERYRSDPEYKARMIASRQKHYNKVKDTPEFKAKNAARYRKWREDHPGPIKQYKRASQREVLQAMSEDQRAAYLEYHREYNKQYRQKCKRYLTDPDYASSLTQVERERIQRSIDNSKASCKEYYANHKAECYAIRREWVANNRERYRELVRQSYRRRKERKALIGVM